MADDSSKRRVAVRDRYVAQFGDPLGDDWKEFEDTRAHCKLWDEPRKEMLAKFEMYKARLNYDEYERIRKEVSGEQSLDDYPDFADKAYSYLCPSKDLATLLSVSDLSEDDWEKAIGGSTEKSREECELQPCCGNISQIRSMLQRCKVNNGLLPDDVEKLQTFLDHHEPASNIPTLQRVFDQLGVSWVE